VIGKVSRLQERMRGEAAELGYYGGRLVRVDALHDVGIERGHNVIICLPGRDGTIRESGACVERRIEFRIRPARNRAAVHVVA